MNVTDDMIQAELAWLNAGLPQGIRVVWDANYRLKPYRVLLESSLSTAWINVATIERAKEVAEELAKDFANV